MHLHPGMVVKRLYNELVPVDPPLGKGQSADTVVCSRAL